MWWVSLPTEQKGKTKKKKKKEKEKGLQRTSVFIDQRRGGGE